MLCLTILLLAEVTDGRLMLRRGFVGVSVKVSGLEGPAYCSSTTRKEVGCPLGCCCPMVAIWPGMVKMYS